MKTIKPKPLHKILDCAELQDGTHIQIEDWHPCYDFLPTCGTLSAYPIAKESGRGYFSPQRGHTFRLAFDFKSEKETRQAYADILSGKKSFKDFRENAQRREYLDMI